MHVHVDTADLPPALLRRSEGYRERERERERERGPDRARNDTMAAHTNITLIQQSRRLSALTDTILDISTVCGDCFKRNTQEFLRVGFRKSPERQRERETEREGDRERGRERERERDVVGLGFGTGFFFSVPPLCPSVGVWAEPGAGSHLQRQWLAPALTPYTPPPHPPPPKKREKKTKN